VLEDDPTKSIFWDKPSSLLRKTLVYQTTEYLGLSTIALLEG